MVEVLGLGPLPRLATVPKEINVYSDPHSRMKELVDEVVEKVQLEVLNLSPGEREVILQSLYRIVWELKTHEIIENTCIMSKLKERLKSLDIYDEMVCNCHQDSTLMKIIELVESLYCSHDSSTRHFYWNKLQEAVYTFMEEFLPHMEEEETTFQPLLSQYFQYEELKQLKTTVLLEHQVWKRRVEAEKNLSFCGADWQWHLDQQVLDRVPVSSCVVPEEVTKGEQKTRRCAEAATLSQFPDELLLQIFSYLPPNQLMTAGRVCSRWNDLSKSPQFWKALHLQHWADRDWRFWPEEESPETRAELLDFTEEAEQLGKADHFYGSFLRFLPSISRGVRRISVAGSTTISDEVMHQLLQSCQNTLEELDASYTPLSERCFRVLRLPCLLKLDLSGCSNITDTALKHLAKAEPRRLAWLSLSGCGHVTDSGLAALQRHAAGSLRFSDLSGCYRLSGAALSGLAAACHHLGPENIAYCSRIEDGPYPDEANGCQNLDCEVRSCCTKY